MPPSTLEMTASITRIQSTRLPPCRTAVPTPAIRALPLFARYLNGRLLLGSITSMPNSRHWGTLLTGSPPQKPIQHILGWLRIVRFSAAWQPLEDRPLGHILLAQAE